MVELDRKDWVRVICFVWVLMENMVRELVSFVMSYWS